MSPSASTVIELGPGRSRCFAPITTLASSFELGLTIHVIQGAKPGPAVGVPAMIDGDELDGVCTSVADLARWMLNYRDRRVGGWALIP